MSAFRRNNKKTKNTKILNEIHDITEDTEYTEIVNNEQSLILQNHASHINNIQGKIDLVMTLENRVKFLEDVIFDLLYKKLT